VFETVDQNCTTMHEKQRNILLQRNKSTRLLAQKVNRNIAIITIISEISCYSALVPHTNTVPLLDLRQLLITFVGMLTYSRPDMFF
jgi:hypothetical protein